MSGSEFDKPADVPIGESVEVSVDWLTLDPDNPRLVPSSGLTNEEIVATLYDRSDLKELIQSISENGYMDIEPLIVWLKKGDSKFTVIEGNRRLATISLFRDPKLVESINKNNSNGISIKLPVLSDEHESSLDSVSVYRIESRKESRQFVGFKHINGTAKWTSYAKAKFAADWYKEYREEGNRDEYISHIARMIGDNHNTVKRMVFAIYVIEQADINELFSIEDCWSGRFGFSHLYVALTRASYMRFLGLEVGWAKYDPEPNPVPEDKLDNLREIFLWIYGSKSDSIRPIIESQNPDIKRLGEVISNDRSLVLLRASRNLEYAHASTTPQGDAFKKFLVDSERMLVRTMENMDGYDGSEASLLSTAVRIKEHAEMIYNRMKKKIRERNDEGDVAAQKEMDDE